MRAKNIAFLLFLLGLTTISSFAQDQNANLAIWADSKVGQENLPINNGIMYSDFYILKDKNSQYLIDKKYELGSVYFDEQIYDNLHINYDVYKDLLLLKTNGEQDLRAVSVIKNKTKFFILSGKKFVNLEAFGFHEEKIISQNITLFTKHSKGKSEKIEKNYVVVEFANRKQFLISYKNTFLKYSKVELLKTYPNFNSEINNYYSENSRLEKSDEQQFVENLLTYLESLSK